MPRFRASVCNIIAYSFIGIITFEFLFLNLVFLYTVATLKNKLAPFFTESSDTSLFDQLLHSTAIRNLIYEGKKGGFSHLIQQTIERVFIVSDSGRNEVERLSFLGLDVSHSGEFTYLSRRIQFRGRSFLDNYQTWIIDIGANDGLLSSNSFNFIQWGWNATLVEPQASELDLARINLQRYIDRYNEGHQKVTLVHSVIGTKDGTEDFVFLKASAGMESHIFDPEVIYEDEHKGQELIMSVPSLTVATFAARYEIPINFGILSIDAEGVSDAILHQFINQGFRPAYIIYERLHNKEPFTATHEFLKRNGYKLLKSLGWNAIYEHNLKF